MGGSGQGRASPSVSTNRYCSEPAFFYCTGHTSAFYPTKSQFFRSFIPQKAGCLLVESDLSVLTSSVFYKTPIIKKNCNQAKSLFSPVGADFGISEFSSSQLTQNSPTNRYLLGGWLRELQQCPYAERPLSLASSPPGTTLLRQEVRRSLLAWPVPRKQQGQENFLACLQRALSILLLIYRADQKRWSSSNYFTQNLTLQAGSSPESLRFFI